MSEKLTAEVLAELRRLDQGRSGDQLITRDIDGTSDVIVALGDDESWVSLSHVIGDDAVFCAGDAWFLVAIWNAAQALLRAAEERDALRLENDRLLADVEKYRKRRSALARSDEQRNALRAEVSKQFQRADAAEKERDRLAAHLEAAAELCEDSGARDACSMGDEIRALSGDTARTKIAELESWSARAIALEEAVQYFIGRESEKHPIGCPCELCVVLLSKGAPLPPDSIAARMDFLESELASVEQERDRLAEALRESRAYIEGVNAPFGSTTPHLSTGDVLDMIDAALTPPAAVPTCSTCGSNYRAPLTGPCSNPWHLEPAVVPVSTGPLTEEGRLLLGLTECFHCHGSGLVIARSGDRVNCSICGGSGKKGST